jgi:hypothetical protein
MKCKNVIREINMYIDNELPDIESDNVKNHIAMCPHCGKIYNGLVKVKEGIGSLPVFNPNPYLWTRIEAELRENPFTPGLLNIPQIIRTWVSIASILVIVFGIVLYNLPQAEDNSDTASSSITNSIMEIPNTPENMEKLAINFLVYTNGYAWEAPYAKF